MEYITDGVYDEILLGVRSGKDLKVFAPREVWVVTMPRSEGGHPFAACWNEEKADELVKGYHETTGDLVGCTLDEALKKYGPARKYKVSIQGLHALLKEVDSDDKLKSNDKPADPED